MFMRSWDDVTHAVNVLRWLRTAIDEVELPPSALEAEKDNVKKAVLERGRTGDGHVTPEGITNTGDVTIPGIEYFGDWLAQRKPALPDHELDLRVVKGTSHGWPTYVSGGDSATNVDLMFHIWLAGGLAKHHGDWNAVEEDMRAEGYYGPGVSAIMFSRSGPMAKPVPHFALTEEGIVRMAETVGAFPRERQVFAVPTFVNLYLRPAATRVKYALRTDPSFKHGAADQLYAFVRGRPHLTFISEDISGYDRSVTRRMQRDLLDKVYKRFLTPEEARAYDDLQEMPVLAPPLKPSMGGFMYCRAGMTISGSIFTTNDGTVLNSCSIAAAVATALDIPLSQVWSEKGGRWDLLVLGDDCVIGFDVWDEGVRARYLAARRSHGFKTDTFTGVVFLMTAVDPKASYSSGILSRAVSKTFFREHDATSLYVDLFGLYTRWARCASHPLAPEAWRRAVATHPMGVRFGLANLDKLKRLVESPAFVRGLLAENRDLGARKALRDILVGLGHGDLSDGLELVPAAFALFGGLDTSELEFDPGVQILSDYLRTQYSPGLPVWRPYMRTRFAGGAASDAARRMKFLSLSQ